MTLMNWVILSFYATLLVVLSLFALHRLWLAYKAGPLFQQPEVKRGEDKSVLFLPAVLVQLPLYNERYVAKRVIEAVCKLDYPQELLTIQVLDDSTDNTQDIVAALVAKYRQEGYRISQECRQERTGFKAGALAAGLAAISPEQSTFVAIFDADFVPRPDFLKSLLGEFKNPAVGMVQARWGYLNREHSLLTAVQAILLDGHFVNEHGGRFMLGRFFNFNGTCGIWRRTCIEQAGGWSGKTLTEDLELSYRAQLAGWRFVYRPDVVVEGELPMDANAFKAQQHRWAKGAVETAILLLGRIWRHSTLGWRVRLEATFHLVGNIGYLLLLILTFLLPWVLVAKEASGKIPGAELVWILDLLLFSGSTLSLLMFYFLAEKRVRKLGHLVKYAPAMLALGAGLAINNTRALLEACLGYKTSFQRTPKRGEVEVNLPKLSASYISRGGVQNLLEIAMAIYVSMAICGVWLRGRYLSLPFLFLSAGGFWWLALSPFKEWLNLKLGALKFFRKKEPVSLKVTDLPSCVSTAASEVRGEDLLEVKS